MFIFNHLTGEFEMSGKVMLTAGTNREERLISFLQRLGLSKCEKVNLEKAKVKIVRKSNGLYYVTPT
jgi:hypothetical protein